MREDSKFSKAEFEAVSKIPFGPFGVIVLVVTSILLLAGVSWALGGTAGMQFAGVVTSGILTAALVGLYYHQTILLRGQIDLRTQEINREVRLNHTETLRQRIHAWLGTNEIPQTNNSIEDIIHDNGERLPKVTAADVEPAESYVYSFDSPEEFRVIPFGLERDRYFDDLLKNHAPELKKRKERINQLYTEFAEYRDRFKSDFEGVSLNEAGLRAEPDQYLSNCIFEGIVKIERGRSESWDDELRVIRNAFDDGGYTAQEEDELRFMQGIQNRRSIYCVSSEERPVHKIPDETATNLAKEVLQKTVDQINTDEDPYRDAVKAADILDSLESEIRELRVELIEYAGRPVFPGQCKYLNEAALGNTEGSERLS